MKKIIVIMAMLGLFPIRAQAEIPCDFDDSKNEYKGAPLEQATCLLRKVNRYGKLAPETPLKKTISSKINLTKLDFTIEEFKNYLKKNKIDEEFIGGELSVPLNFKTRYFIIHDTSTPNFKASPFPSDINETSNGLNKLSKYQANAHIYINRLGNSSTKVDLAENCRTTKFENNRSNRKYVYVSVELIQPRRSSPEGRGGNDALAPLPGFTDKQMERLAVVYYAASIRAKKYLIPAFHSVIDAGMKDAHDDPQNFDISEWDRALDKVYKEIKTKRVINFF